MTSRSRSRPTAAWRGSRPACWPGAVQQVAHAAAVDEKRPILTGIFLKVDQARITLAAADGCRLAESWLPADVAGLSSSELVLPAAALARLASLWQGRPGVMDLFVSQDMGRIRFKTEHDEAGLCPLQGRFPAYDRIIPEHFKTRLVCERQALLKAVRLGQKFVPPQAGIRLQVAAGDGEGRQLVVQGASPELGDTTLSLEAQVQGEGPAARLRRRLPGRGPGRARQPAGSPGSGRPEHRAPDPAGAWTGTQVPAACGRWSCPWRAARPGGNDRGRPVDRRRAPQFRTAAGGRTRARGRSR